MPIKMNYKTLTKVILILATLTTIGCSKDVSSTYTYEPLTNITYTVKTRELKYHSDTKSVFMRFELAINNKSNKEVYLDISKIKASLNSELSSETYYDSVASVLPKKEKLKKGASNFKLYFVYSENLREKNINKFKITSYGLSES